MSRRFLPRRHLNRLHQALVQAGYEVIGPRVKDDTIVFAPLEQVDDLPWGWQEQADAGRYRLQHTAGRRAFAWNTGPQGLKPWLFQPEQVLWRAEHTETGLNFRAVEPSPERLAFIGLRGCDLAALKIQDQHFLDGPYADPFYRAQREQLFMVAVNCGRSADTCFCVSTGDGPEARFGFDLLLDELDDGYLLQTGSAEGDAIAAHLPLNKASVQQLNEAKTALAGARRQQRTMPATAELAQLVDRLDHPRWQQVAERCLACGNCTSVCPTCFCSKQDSEGDIRNRQAEQVQRWDSCFSEQHSYITGKVVRHKIQHRYRQWLVHKLATWQQQFGRSGCVGCGRCIAWCPVAIDLVEEAHALLETPKEGEHG
ncbi:4Fe-4S dicluster domain-containing protein [Oceanimonas sp. CHS3-5]|uniref:4Fe-4S dicluster domain-containing protein n=1 Tax=Oceanimonas sp. CHS3-5 TaxID=3068186 RepID=UPI00273E4440|nr:4Fe-4S dicluster domain-containing protein [Oceanimonas sp. CHS3-5]MDP5291387.1 4Fe-4S dicluster domain-containing protein [Oceanimonas sp. CHS3-5]